MWSLHGLLVLLVPARLLAWLLALLAPLALFVFVSAVAVALLAVVPPPAAAAGEEVVEREQRRWRGCDRKKKKDWEGFIQIEI